MLNRFFLLIPCAMLSLALPTFAADDEKDAAKELEEKERLEAQEEEKKEQEKTSLAYEALTLRGTLALNAPMEGDSTNTPVGSFNTLRGSFLVKFEDLQLRKDLLAQNGKVVTLTGKLRNQGKYFIVLRYEAAPAKGAKKPLTRAATPGGL